MKNIFKQHSFKILCIIVSLLIVISVLFAIIGKIMSPQSSLVSAILVPVHKAYTAVSRSVTDWFSAYDRIDLLEAENSYLKDTIRAQNEKLIGYDEYKNENEFLHEFLDIKEKHNDFEFLKASLISKDSMSEYGNFTIDVGSVNGVSAHDPVITADGLVGYIGELGITTSKVYTILDPQLNIGAIDTRTGDTGVVQGDAALAKANTNKMSYLSKNASITIGDYIITSGTGGVFPQGIYIGTVLDVSTIEDNISNFATISPVVDFNNITDVMVITSFDGQGNILE